VTPVIIGLLLAIPLAQWTGSAAAALRCAIHVGLMRANARWVAIFDMPSNSWDTLLPIASVS
jgi:hypothetical protein